MPFLDAAVAARKRIRQLHSNGNALGVSDAPTRRWAKAGVQDRKLQKTVGAENAMRFTQGKPVIGHVHQRHEGRGEIKAGIAEWKVGATCHLIYDPAACCLCVLDECRCDVDCMHPSTSCSKEPCIAALATAEVNAIQTGNWRQHGKESRGVVLVAVKIGRA